MKQIQGLVIWISPTIAFWIANYYYPHEYIENAFYTFVALTGIHITFKIILYKHFSKKIKEKRTRYSFKKITSILYVGLFIAALAAIWSGGTQEVTVAFGLVTAGIVFVIWSVVDMTCKPCVIPPDAPENYYCASVCKLEPRWFDWFRGFTNIF